MKRSLPLVFFLITLSAGFAQNACRQKIETHLRLVGDSWMQFPVIYQSYDSALAKYGFPDYNSTGDGTALISMTAETWWQFPLAHLALESSLSTDVNRSIDVVIISLGGNDVVFHIHVGDSLSVLDDDLDDAKLFMDSIFGLIHDKEPNAQIIWQSYDYPNFTDPCMDYSWDPYCNLWASRGYPTPYDMNRVVKYLTDYDDSVVRGYNLPYIHFFNANGLMQWQFGQVQPLRYAPFGTYPPRSVPFPGGNMDYPTPYPAMGLGGIDTYHLGQQGFFYHAEFYMRKFISNYLRRNRDTTFHSLGQNFDGWTDANHVTGTGNVLVGKRNTVNTKGIFSFNTFVPDGKVVKKAALFLKEKTLTTPFPISEVFPQTFKLDIKTGAFGNDGIEGDDYNAVSSSDDVACFAGNLRGDGYTLRADLHDDALKYINKNGLTQFRLEFSDDNLINFYNGDTAEFEGPYLDLYFENDVSTGIVNHQVIDQTLKVYPNPAINEITLQLNKEWQKKDISVNIYDTKGALVSAKKMDKVQNEIKMDISSLADGGYFVSIEDNENKSVGTFVKQQK